jgi:hypothetical protein
MLFDTGSPVNLVDQKHALEQGYEKVDDADLPDVGSYLFEGLTYVFAAYRIQHRWTDSWGHESEGEIMHYAVQGINPPILVGMPALNRKGIVINCGTEEWRHGLDDPKRLDIHAPQRFRRQIEKGKTAVVYANVV